MPRFKPTRQRASDPSGAEPADYQSEIKPEQMDLLGLDPEPEDDAVAPEAGAASGRPSSEQVAELGDRVQELEQEREVASTEKEALKGRIAELEEAAGKMEARHKAQITRRDTELARLQAAADRALEEESAVDQAPVPEVDADGAVLRIQMLERNLENARRKSQETQRKLLRQEEEYRTLCQQSGKTEQTLSSQVDKLKKEMRQQTRELNEIRQKLQMRDDEQKNFTQRANQREQTLTRQVQQLKSQTVGITTGGTSDAERRLKVQQQRADDLQKNLEETEMQWKNRNELIQHDLADARRESKQIQQRLAEVESGQERRIDELLKNLALLQQEAGQFARQLEEDAAQLKQQNRTLEQRLQDVTGSEQAVRKEYEAFQNQVQEHAGSTNERLESVHQQNVTLERDKAGLEDRIQQLEGQVKALNEQAEDAAQALAGAVQEKDNTRAEYRLLADQTKKRETELIARIEELEGKPFTQEKPLE